MNHLDVKVSVAIPAYNQAAYLREALASVLAQTHTDLEVVVVDDGSTDETRAVCESTGDARVRYIYQPNDRTMGIGARNRAMLEARGEWIALLDQDDRWAPDKIESQLALAARDPSVGAVFCRVRFIDGEGHVTGEQERGLPDGDVFHDLIGHNRYFAASGMFKRELLQVIGLPHAWVGLGDHALWLSVARRTKVLVVDQALADYRIHAQGYQARQLASGLVRLADDAWQTVSFQHVLLHRGCSECRDNHRRARRAVAVLYLRALRTQLASGRFAGGRLLLGRAIASAPLWLLQPWVLLREPLRLVYSAGRGLIRRARSESTK